MNVEKKAKIHDRKYSKNKYFSYNFFLKQMLQIGVMKIIQYRKIQNLKRHVTVQSPFLEDITKAF